MEVLELVMAEVMPDQECRDLREKLKPSTGAPYQVMVKIVKEGRYEKSSFSLYPECLQESDGRGISPA